MASPYSLPWGSSIYATVQATNAYGTSGVSLAGNGATILTTPAAVTVSNFAPGTTSTQIYITWTASASNGGTAVIDYEVQYQVNGGAFSVLASGVTGLSY